MKKNLICFLFQFIYLVAFGQNKSIDSLKTVLKTSSTNQEKTVVLNELANQIKTINPKQTIAYATSALEISKQTNDISQKGLAYINIGNANIILGKYSDALDNFVKAQAVFETQLNSNSFANKQDVKNNLARTFGSIGIVFSEQSNYSKALLYHFKAVKLYEETKNFEKCARVYNNIGVEYRSLNENEKALNYFLKCLTLQDKIHDQTKGTTATNIGSIYLKKNDISKSLEFFEKAENIFNINHDIRGFGELYNNYAKYYIKKDNPDEAINQLKKAIEKFNSIDDRFGTADSYAQLGEIYFNQGNYNLALKNTKESIKLAREIGIIEQIEISEKLLSQIYEKQNKPIEALKHFKLHSIARDSLNIVLANRNNIRAELQYDFEKKAVIYKKEQEKQQIMFSEAKREHNLILFFAILFALLLAGISFLIYNRFQLKKTLTLEKEVAEYKQKTLHLQMNPHFVFNCLGSISSFILQNNTDEAILYLAKFSKLMRLTLEYSKESLIPIDKEIESLQNYLELEQLRFNSKFDFKINKDKSIEDDVALPPLLLQPFVENSILHGLNPKTDKGFIEVSFSLEDEVLVCTIQDNGVGYHKSQEYKKTLVKVHKSMAVEIIKKRLEMMDSEIDKKSSISIEEINIDGEIKGTKVTLHLALQYYKG